MDECILVENAETHPLRCICGSADLQDLGPCRRPSLVGLSECESALSQQVQPGRLYRCRRCFLGLRLPRPDISSLEKLYSGLSSDRWKCASPLTAAQQLVLRLVKKKKADDSLRVLDVGAFDGRFLEALPSEFQKSAIEPSCSGHDILQKKGFQVIGRFLAAAEPGDQQKFDLVTMFDVFEHLSNPLAGMQDLMSYLKPGGTLFVGTADLDHWSWYATRGNHWYLDPMQHIAVGSRRHFEWVRSVLPAANLRIYRLSHRPPVFPATLVQSAQLVYFGVKEHLGAGCIALRLMHRIPFFRRLAHKEAVPYTQQVRDHLLAEFTRLESPR